MSDAAAMPRRTEYRANTSAPAYLGPSCELDREDWCPPHGLPRCHYQGRDLSHSHHMQAQAINPLPPREAWQYLIDCIGSLLFHNGRFFLLLVQQHGEAFPRFLLSEAEASLSPVK